MKSITRRTFHVAIIGLVSLSIPLAVHAQDAAKKTRVLLLTGFDVGSHDWKSTTAIVRDTLEKEGECQVSVCEDLGILESSSLAKYDVIVLNFGFWKEPEPSDAAKKALIEFVRNGKGLVALHFACSAFQDWTDYHEMLGRVWKKGIGGHGPLSEFTVKIANSNHPVTSGVAEFRIADELYSRLSGDTAIDVLAEGYSDWSKNTEPLVFSHNYGKGRVVQNVLGHTLESRKSPAYRKLLIQSVQWAAGRN